MSLHRELKGIDEILRAAMTRRDLARRAVNKHVGKSQAIERKIQKSQKALEDLQESTAENIAKWTDDLMLNEDYTTLARGLFDQAEAEVNQRLDDLGAD